MSRSEKHQGIISGILVLILTVILFVLIDNKDANFWVYWFFSVIALMSPTLILVLNRLMKTRDTFLGRPSYFIGITYALIQVVLGLLLLLTKLEFKYFVLIQIVLFLVFIAVLVSANFIKTRTEHVEEQYKEKAKFRDEAHLLLSNLVLDVQEPSLKSQVNKLIEAVRYSDPITVSSANVVEADILDRINILSMTGNVTQDGIDDIARLLAKRANILKANKR